MCLSNNAACKKCNPEMELVRLEVNVNQETADALRSIMRKNGISATEAVRRAIAVNYYLSQEYAKGRKIHTMNQDGKKVREVIF